MSERTPIQISQPCLGDEELAALRGPLESGWLTQGPEVAAFEREFAEHHAVKHAIAVTSCTTGLHLALLALGVGPGDEVIVPAFTWVATANAVLYCGATPTLVDVSSRTFNLDTKKLAAAINPRTKAIVAVHLFGRCAEIEEIRAIAPAGVKLVEDAACAAGAIHGNRWAGGLGDIGVFSFHPRKSITTGEGGMITTDDDELAAQVQQLRNHGASISEEQRHVGPRPYILPDFPVLGYNYRMTDLQGAVGRAQLAKLDGFIEERARWASYYRRHLGNVSWLALPEEPAAGRHAWQAFVCHVDPASSPLPRNEMMERLQERGVATRPGTHSIHCLSYYRERFGFTMQDFPGAADCDAQTMAIPLHNRMTQEDYDHVIESIRSLG